MSLSTDVLAKATPTRLICRGGRWVLELTRLEAVDRDVFQPRLQRLEGAEPILALLRRSDEGQNLASGAAQLMRGGRPDEDRAFEVNEGDWVPSSSEHSPAARPAPAAEQQASELASVVAELRAELVVLRASHSRLRERVMALEAAQSGVSASNLRAPRGSRGRRRSEPPAAGFAPEAAAAAPLENPGFAATQASPALGAPRPAPTPEASAAGKQPSFEELARAIAGEQLPPVLGIPTLAALNDCLSTLMEGAPALSPSAAHELTGLVSARACKLLDDEGRECGAILLDLRAAVLLGAALLAVPRDEALRQVTEADPSEDALLAMSEICNNLTAPVNAVAGNRHVRATALSGVDVGELPQLRARLDLTVDGGRVVLAMF